MTICAEGTIEVLRQVAYSRCELPSKLVQNNNNSIDDDPTKLMCLMVKFPNDETQLTELNLLEEGPVSLSQNVSELVIVGKLDDRMQHLRKIRIFVSLTELYLDKSDEIRPGTTSKLSPIFM